ncbi:hypothetical protein LWI28_002199 [Acer negundo]|uniref:Uncharacterized protein n=1 Tax=Acer negundo TaxID=4023 RepID=A0AAD5IX01_ACENE|nr:hypothetical protein LWI28_002199 [Acer negundo]
MTLAQSGGEGDFSQERAEFNREDIEKFKHLLGTLEKSTGSGIFEEERSGPTTQPMPVLDSEPNPSVDIVEVISNSKSHENDVPVVDDEDLPIAIRKGVRECTW